MISPKTTGHTRPDDIAVTTTDPSIRGAKTNQIPPEIDRVLTNSSTTRPPVEDGYNQHGTLNTDGYGHQTATDNMDSDTNSSTDQMIDLQPDYATASNYFGTIDPLNPDDSTNTNFLQATAADDNDDDSTDTPMKTSEDESTGTIVFQPPNDPTQNPNISYIDSEWNSDPWTPVISKSNKKKNKTKKLQSSANDNSNTASFEDIPNPHGTHSTLRPPPPQTKTKTKYKISEPD